MLLMSIAAVCMLVSCINGKRAQEHARGALVDEKQRAEGSFFDYVAQSYRFFLAGDDYQCSAVDAAKAAEFEERAQAIRAQNRGLQQACFSLEYPNRSWMMEDAKLGYGR